MTVSPRSAIAFASLLTLLVVFLMLALAQSTPQLGLRWEPGPDNTLAIASVEPGSPQAGQLAAGDIVTHFLLPDTAIPATPVLLVEEPDTLPDYTSYNTFMQDQAKLATGLQENTLRLRLADGREVSLQTRAAGLGDLPFLFWFQIFVGAAGVMTGAIVWTLGEKNRATLLYALTGFGYLVFAPTAAVYSTRELALDSELFRALSVANHFGALFFTASLTALLWHYPRSLGKFPVVALCYLAALICWLLDTFQIPETPLVFHLGVLAIFMASFIFAGGHWLRTRGQPADRAALRWFLLSIYLATGLFAGTIILPAALNLPLPAPQGVMFGAFLIMYWGLALGVVRYRLFRLEEWWYSIWSWFLSGVAVVLLDFLLISALHVDAGIALSLSVAIVGWLYFPLRQWLWNRLGRAPQRSMQDWLPAALPLLIQMPEGEDRERRLQERWPELLRTVFAPLSIENSAGRPGIQEDGLALRLADVQVGAPPLLMRHAENGSRLFTRHDVETLTALRRLFDLALEMLRAHESGANAERERIARDMHDDLGARLLTLLYRSPETEKPLVREAITCTRELINTLNLTPVPLALAASRWRLEVRERTEAAGIRLHWTILADETNPPVLSARQHANLTRILREAVTNAIKHGQPENLHITLEATQSALLLEVRDDGNSNASSTFDQGGRGCAIMQARSEELGGHAEWIFAEGCTVRVELPVTAPATQKPVSEAI